MVHKYKEQWNMLLLQPFYGPLIQDNPGESVLSQKKETYWNNHRIFMSWMSFLPLNL